MHSLEQSCNVQNHQAYKNRVIFFIENCRYWHKIVTRVANYFILLLQNYASPSSRGRLLYIHPVVGRLSHFVSSDRSSYSDSVLLCIQKQQQRPLFENLSNSANMYIIIDFVYEILSAI